MLSSAATTNGIEKCKRTLQKFCLRIVRKKTNGTFILLRMRILVKGKTKGFSSKVENKDFGI